MIRPRPRTISGSGTGGAHGRAREANRRPNRCDVPRSRCTRTPSTVSTVLNEYLREFQAKLKATLEHAERSSNAKEADRLRKVLLELDEYEHAVLYPLASQNIAIDLDDGVKANYPKLGAALKKIPGLEASE